MKEQRLQNQTRIKIGQYGIQALPSSLKQLINIQMSFMNDMKEYAGI